MNSIIADLNPQQRKALDYIDGPLLILAGAGSGKTKTLTHRVAYLISEKKIMPEQILAVTFTNKAANEMRERVASLLGRNNSDRRFMPFMGTFHSICVRILRRDGDYVGVLQNFIIFDASDSVATVNRACKQLGVDTKKHNPKMIAAMISGAKTELVSQDEFASLAMAPTQKVALEVWPIYERLLKEAGALDFDDLIGKTVELLSKHGDVRKKWQRQFAYILVDEYQDTNSAQYQLIKLLVNKHKNICVVGDDWQSIYSWRGADYRNILNFKQDYPKTRVIKLEQNYRSTKNILDGAHSIIVKNRNRSKKKLWTKSGDGSPIHVVPVLNETKEGEFIVETIKSQNQEYKYSDFTVLYRTNAQSRSLEEQFIRYGVPYKIVGGVRFYDRKEVKDIVAYARLVYQPNDSASFERIANVPTRGIGSVSLNKFNSWRNRENLDILSALIRAKESNDLTPRAKQAFESLGRILVDLREFVSKDSVEGLLDAITKRTDYLKYVNDGSIQGEMRAENVKELISVAKEYESLGLEGFLEEVALLSDLDSHNSNTDAVTLMTLHAAKGLEFPVVFMSGMEETIFPHSRSLFDSKEMEEERRLCYVGMTRAMRELYLIHASSRLLYGNVQHNPPSRFISDIDETVIENTLSIIDTPSDINNEISYQPDITIELAPRDRVRHPVFGTGEVTVVDGDMVTVRFRNRGSKLLNAAYAPLEKLS